MEDSARVCPFCGSLPGGGVFCASCGRNLAAVEQLPTRVQWEAGHRTGEAAPPPSAQRSAEALREFLDAMHAAGDPGAAKTPMTAPASFGRTRWATGWVVRAVHREDGEIRRFDPGLFLTTEGVFHRLDSEVRGWGQRDFPRFRDMVGDPLDAPPVDARIVDELDALRRRHGVGG